MAVHIGWFLMAAALAVGYYGWGWRGVVLGLTVIVFWLLLQFSRGLRALREAAGRPVGEVPNALMFNAKLHAGLRLTQILKMTRSLGTKLAEEPETYQWQDAAGDKVRVELKNGAVTAWTLQRAAQPPPGETH
jgi:hypothetical protein